MALGISAEAKRMISQTAARFDGNGDDVRRPAELLGDGGRHPQREQPAAGKSERHQVVGVEGLLILVDRDVVCEPAQPGIEQARRQPRRNSVSRIAGICSRLASVVMWVRRKVLKPMNRARARSASMKLSMQVSRARRARRSGCIRFLIAMLACFLDLRLIGNGLSRRPADQDDLARQPRNCHRFSRTLIRLQR